MARKRPVAAFCRVARISEGSFYSWRKRLGGKRRRGFLPVRIIAYADPKPVAAAVEIALTSGRVVRVRPGFDPEILGRVLAVE